VLSATLDNPVRLLPELADDAVSLLRVGIGTIYLPRSFPRRLSQLSDLLFGMLALGLIAIASVWHICFPPEQVTCR
jgi:hypothetical protein